MDLSRKVLARFQGELQTDEMWESAVGRLPRGLQRDFLKAKKKDTEKNDVYTETLEHEMFLGSDRNVSISIKVSMYVGEDADEGGRYGISGNNLEYFFMCDDWDQGGDGDLLDFRQFERDLAKWLELVKRQFPDVAQKHF